MSAPSEGLVRSEVYRMLKQLGAAPEGPAPKPPKQEQPVRKSGKAAKARQQRELEEEKQRQQEAKQKKAAKPAAPKAKPAPASGGVMSGAAPAKGASQKRGRGGKDGKKSRNGPDRRGMKDSVEVFDGPWHSHPSAKQLAEGALPVSRKAKRRKFKQQKEEQEQAAADGAEAPAAEEKPFQALLDGVKAKVAKAAAAHKHRGSDSSFVRSVLSSGTLSDKVAAMTLMVQESPMTSLRVLDQLMAMARKKGRREASMALETLRDLFVSDLLPNRPMRRWQDQPLHLAEGHEGEAEWQERLQYWYLESELKARYAEFVDIVSRITHDTMQYMKKGSVSVLYDLLSAKPENERALLQHLVNKLGDPDRKVASKVVFLLSQLLQPRNHPGMKAPVMREVEHLLFRPNVSERAQYYGIVFLNQMMLSRNDSALASQLIGIYFALFKRLISQEGGVMAPTMTEKQKRQAELKARRKRKRALQRSGGKRGQADGAAAAAAAAEKERMQQEANRGLQSKMLSALLTGVNRAFPYSGGNSSLYEEHADVIYRLVHKGTFVAAVQGLMLLFQVMAQGSTSAADRFYRALYSKLFAPELTMAAFSPAKRAQFLNLVYKAMKRDTSPERVCAFARRVLQLCLHQQAPFVCGVLYMLSEVSRRQSALRRMVTAPEESAPVAAADPSSEEEEEEEEDEAEEGEDIKVVAVSAPGPKEEDGEEVEEDKASAKAKAADEGYSSAKREPKYARARGTCLWELDALCRHFHPSVALFARTLRGGAEFIKYGGDPLKDFTSQAFLDRFVYRNPKNLTDKERASLRGSVSLQNIRQSRASTAAPVNSEAFLATPEERVPVDERFFHRFFAEKARRDGGKKKAKKTAEEEDADMEEFADRLIEKELLKMAGGVDVDEDDAASGAAEFDYTDSEEEEEGSGDEADESALFGAFKGPDASDEGEEDSDEEEAPKAKKQKKAKSAMEFSDSDDDSDSGDEAAAMKEAFGGGAGDDDSDDDSDLSEDGSDEDGGGKDGVPAVSSGGAAFADAEEFAHLLESAGKATGNAKLAKWQSRGDWSGRKRGGGGSKKRRR